MWHEYPYTDAHELNLDWFLKEFKELVETWEQVQSDWNSLHDYVQDYFDNLNVQTEIDNKINAMIADGTFADIVSPFVTAALPALVAGQLPDVVAAQISSVVASQISAIVADQLPAVAATVAAAEVGDWLAAHIDPDTGYVIDNTLTVSNAAADAKVTGDSIRHFDYMLENEIGENPGDYMNALNNNILRYVHSKNLLFTGLTWEDGILNSDYNVITEGYTGYSTSDFIPVITPNIIALTRLATIDSRMFFTIRNLAGYDSNKNPIGYINNTIDSQSVLTIPKNSAFIRISTVTAYVVTSPNIYKPMLSYESTVEAYESYFAPYHKVIKQYPESTNDIACWGDSLTYGSGSTSDYDYPSVLAGLTGKTVHNCGFPGDDSAEIAGYQGGMNLIVKPVTIPASGSVNVDIYTYNEADSYPFRYPSIDAANINPVIIGGVKGNLDLSAASNTNTRTFSFTRLESGDAVSLIYDTPIITSGSVDRKRDIQVFWVGANGGWDLTNTTLIKQIDNMINHSDVVDRKYIVVGIAIGLAVGYSIPLEKDMELYFGNHYINMRDYLIRCGLTENNITPTAQDLQDISDGKVPTSLKASDGVHLNDYGYNSVAHAIYRKGVVLGYWT